MLLMTELSTAGYPARLVAALSAWETRCDRVGRGGNQSELHRQMTEQFGAQAPSRSAVSKWMRTMVPPEPQYGEMLAVVLGVRPAWLYFADGRMVASTSETSAETAAARNDQRARAFQDEQSRRYPPRPKRAIRPRPDEQTG